ncbi:unnamed protein product [Mesocestoides corti]|uniref:Uncharacterized protein n=1 Tax=Mesocestoides corti TaxID=53468 RepID=A0A3P6GD55_MESCO|nr:unnamed protein product [Mesocestoides corti]
MAGEAVVEEAELAVEDGAVAAAVAAAAAAADEAEGPAARKSRKGVLAQLRELRVAVSAFSPCEHKNLMRLAQMFNMLRPDIRMDTEWPTVVFSRELADNEVSQVSLAQRHQSASSARRALPTHPQQAPSPQQRLQQPPPTVTAPAQSPRLPPQPPLPPQHQQQQQQQPLRHMVATPNDYSAPSPHQTRMPVAMQYANNGNQLAGATNSQPRATLSGPNSIEPPQSHHMQQAAQMSMGLAGPNSVPDAFGGYQTSHASPMAPAYTLVPPSSMESQSARSLHQPMSNDGARAGLSPAMASDPYLRASYSHSASPMRPATAAPTATTTTTPTAEQQSASGLLGSSESLNHDQLKQQQPVASPYTIQGPPNSVDAGNVPSAPQFHLRQHPSPYQAPQPSPASNNPNPSSTAVGGQYHAPVQSYHISEMSRYQNSASPLNPMRPASTAPGMMMPEDRVIVWEGQLGVRGQAIVHLRLLSDASAPRINLQWQNCANLMLQLEQVERDSHLGQMFLHRMPSYLLQLQLYVAFKNQEHEMALSSRMRSLTPSTFTLGILPPLNSWSSPISPGILAFVCFLATDDGRIIGLVPKDSEIFRGDILNRQLHKRPRLMSEKQQQQQSAFLTQQQQQQQHPQYESNIPEMQQQQQPSPAYSVNSLSLPNTPGKMVRLPAVTAPTPINRVSGPSARLPGSMMDANEMPQPHPTPPQYLQQQQQPRQPPHQVVPSWQDQRQPGMTGDVTQQPQRPYSMMPPTQQQSQFMMQSVAGSQVQQQQHLYHQTGMAMGQSPYAPQVQPKLPPGMLVSQQQQQQRPASGYPSHAPQRQQLRDASGRFQSSSAVAAAASATPMPPEYHTPLPPSYTPAPGAATPVYEYPGMQQTQRMPPTPGYVRTASPMRPGYPQPSNQRMASAYPPGRQPMSVGGRGLPSRGVNMRGPIPQAPTPSHLMMPGDAIMYENHQEQQVAFDPSQAGSAPSQQNLF